MVEVVELERGEPLQGYQLRIVQEVLLALLAKEASHGYQLQARLALALGPTTATDSPASTDSVTS